MNDNRICALCFANRVSNMPIYNPVFGVLIAVSDPPCDPGFNCNFDDETVGIAIMFWVGVFALAAICIVFALLADFIKKQYWRLKYGSKDGVIHERADLTRRGYVSNRGQPVLVYRKRREVHVSHECPICHMSSYLLRYQETLGQSPEEACKHQAEHPKQVIDSTQQPN